nr:chemotaxis protein CheW [Marinospirillum sp.]
MSNPATKTGILLESGTNELEIIEFKIEHQQPNGELKTSYFGINVTKVKEVIRMPPITPYPNSHKHLLGIATLRDQTIPLIDLAGWLNLNSKVPLNAQSVIVTDFNNTLHGFTVSSVDRIHRDRDLSGVWYTPGSRRERRQEHSRARA